MILAGKNRIFGGRGTRFSAALPTTVLFRKERKLRVFEIMMLRKILGPKGGEVTGHWWRFHIEEIHDLFSPNNVRMAKPRRMK